MLGASPPPRGQGGEGYFRKAADAVQAGRTRIPAGESHRAERGTDRFSMSALL